MRRILTFCRREAVLCITALCAAVTMFLVPPDAAYWEYMDFRVLGLLFCLMAVVAGLQSCGLFTLLAEKLLVGRKPLRLLSLTLVLLPFFASMLVTNDVALLTFVPFAVLVLQLIGRTRLLPWIVVLQTVAANLGSMATPVGNPQNLYLYSAFSLTAGRFFGTVLPLTVFSLALLIPLSLCVPGDTLEVRLPKGPRPADRRGLILFGTLFLLCLLTVFRVLPWPLLLAVVLAVLLLAARSVFRRVDYSLLLTFVFFFIFAGNLGRIPATREFLMQLMQRYPLTVSTVASQIISNVPAAVLLSDFTGNAPALLAGVNIGGLGTPVASLASLISLKLYLHTPGARGGRYLALFTGINVLFLALLFALAAWLLHTL
ncbi:MAG: citrate transporter [Clostridiales bacterium]|nr:citrate transporter [Clostridiales bacterium]